ncbi:SIS domain-containing protein [Paenibacillus dendritiformis]|uniref:SIS domain-containing protein n=1 Tax=Paenibacillus dendritiformis TaxID=130049 RepID=UPI00105A2031|nr:SIS domain-containing protein [Paenibacillus dendritiformis]TDL58128.1 sugar isomerase domain-containing protein [Paenibacillus dendritiformis]
MLHTYLNHIHDMLHRIEQQEANAISLAATKTAESIMNGGIIHLFGCGHSHILTEEVFYRAGGLVPIRPIFVEKLMLHEGAVRSSELERQNGLAETFMEDQNIRPGEVMFVLSTSGRNPVPVDAALIAKAKGAFTIGITSLAYSQSQPSRHRSGKHLSDAVDLVIDNYAVKGDAILTHPDVPVPFTPTSTVTGAAILNAILAEAIVRMAEQGYNPPVFLSGNIDGADEHNNALIERYRERIPLLS